ncbi:MAG: sulfur carrier protein ThiS [Lentisphaerae bacterium]|nr:sulfur carrier protein ThiS [Lentisphaerota bacterium]
MKITVNGKPYDCPQAYSVLDLLNGMQIPADRVAIVLNDDVISPKRIGYIMLREGDNVEMLTLAAGG